ncbi:MAG: molybdenum cofactor guanylyltransferase [Spirochaetaceae bacterium]|nr:MAG: molybdenum cofactor guanylyltransferase [Spirochaetaceae bacterium]
MKALNAAAILAGGKSTRMGFDKQELMVDGEQLTARLIRALRQDFETVVVVTARPELYQDLAVDTIADIYPGKGPLAGIHAALRFTKAEYVYVTACDMPNYDPRMCVLLRSIIASHKPDACVTRQGEWFEFFHAAYGRATLPLLEKILEGDIPSVGSFLRGVSTHYIPEQDVRLLSPDWDLFRNLNTPDDHQKYLSSMVK